VLTTRMTLDLPDPADWTDALKCWSAAMSAARIGLNPDAGFWTLSDVEECGAEIYAAAIAGLESGEIISAPANLKTLRTATHAVRPVKYNRAPKRATLDPLTGDVPYYPAARFRVSRLMGDVTNWREVQENRKRGEIAAAEVTERRENMRSHAAPESAEFLPDALRGTALAARRFAVSACIALGVDAGWGPHLIAAYTAARSIDGLESAEIAAELELTPAAYRKALSRAHSAHTYRTAARSDANPAARMFRKALKDDHARPVHLALKDDRSAYAAALYVPTGGVAYGVHTAGLETAERMRPKTAAPVRETAAAAAPSASPAAWTAACSPRYAERMRAVAARRAERGTGPAVPPIS
jgi:hypothetical protein